jgi:uncharacterized glyoxalase superfamily protein PhnB
MNLNAIGIVSRDINESVKFYSLLGLKFEECEKDAKHVEANLTNGMRLMLDSEELVKSLRPHWTKSQHSSISLAFEFKSVKELDETFKKLVEAGFKAEKAPWDAFWGQRYAIVLDPDFNSIDLYCSL